MSSISLPGPTLFVTPLKRNNHFKGIPNNHHKGILNNSIHFDSLPALFFTFLFGLIFLTEVGAETW